MTSWRTLAAANNAEWCDLMARSHGAQTQFLEHSWTSRTRPPPYYPDAVTLAPEPPVPDLLRFIDASPGCSIKDSFAALDLSTHGFRVLFDAQWIVRTGVPPAVDPAEPHWQQVRDATALAAWERAWSDDDRPRDLFRAELLEHDSVAVLGAYADDEVVGGAVFNRSSTVVGVSNFFVRPGRTAATWSGCLAVAAELYPAAAVVGYESGDELATAQDHGFETAGLLRVWINDG